MSSDPHGLTVAEAAVAAIEAIGGSVKTAKACGVSRWAVHQWKAAGIPPKQVGKVSSLTGLPPHQLRPDLFQPMKAPKPAQAAA